MEGLATNFWWTMEAPAQETLIRKHVLKLIEGSTGTFQDMTSDIIRERVELEMGLEKGELWESSVYHNEHKILGLISTCGLRHWHNLKEHQFAAVGHILQVWESKTALCSGILLADGMGLGKTLTAIATVLCQRRKDRLSEHCLLPTLIVTPLSVMLQWVAEFRKFASCEYEDEDGFTFESVYCWHKSGDGTAPQLPPGVEIVITNYHSVRFNPKVFTVSTPKWGCLVVDEAHQLRNSNGSMHESMLALNKEHVLLLTGTPYQNSDKDMLAMFSLLGAAYPEDPKRYKNLLQHHMLRRGHECLITPLPELCIQTPNIELSKDEHDFYSKVESQVQFEAQKYVDGTVQLDFMHIFALLLRLRQAAVHPALALIGLAKQGMFREQWVQAAMEEQAWFDPYTLLADQSISDIDRVALKGLSIFNLERRGMGCIKRAVDAGSSKLDWLRDHLEKLGVLTQIDVEASGASTKGGCTKVAKGPPRLSPPPLPRPLTSLYPHCLQVVIFSNWNHMLDLVQHMLNKRLESSLVVRFYGTVDANTRQKTISRFNQADDLSKDRPELMPIVLLVNYKAGGEGLNLQAGTQVVLMDPWWNPAVEDQAIGRCHRFGQTQIVTALHPLSEGTIEYRVRQIAESKREAAAYALGDQSKSNPEKLNRSEFLALLGLGPSPALTAAKHPAAASTAAAASTEKKTEKEAEEEVSTEMIDVDMGLEALLKGNGVLDEIIKQLRKSSDESRSTIRAISSTKS